MRRYAIPRVRNSIKIFCDYCRASRSPLILHSWPVYQPSNTCTPFLDIRRYGTLLPPSQNPIKAVQQAVTSSFEDTIFALSTAPGRAGIAIVRISGPSCLDIYRVLCPGKPLPKPRQASLRTIYSPGSESNTRILDSDAFVLYFPAPRTVTGEEILELHIHGGLATVKAVLAAVPDCATSSPIRYAEPGEFTRRAFQNNRLDLAQVEALSDTLSAETEQQRRAAVRGNSGALGKTYESWRQQLLEARGELEAIIDFSEDQDFDSSSMDLLANIKRQIDSIIISTKLHEQASSRGELLRKGIKVSMLGHPNTGKSSLLNLIIGREASIVSNEAGTTRDVVEVGLDIDGYLCTFADTAGLRSAPPDVEVDGIQDPQETVGKVEQEGIRRARAKASESDLILVLASVEPSRSGQGWEIRCDQEALEIASNAQEHLIIVNKRDLIPESEFDKLLEDFKTLLSSRKLHHRLESIIPVSCLVAQDAGKVPEDPGNIRYLINSLSAIFQKMTTILQDEHLLGVTERQRQLLQGCRVYCEKYIKEAHKSSSLASNISNDGEDGSFDIVLAAEYLRSAANCLSRITGRGEASDVEEVLGVVFEKFCVGK